MTVRPTILRRILVYSLLVVVSVIVLLPILWAVSASLKPLDRIFVFPLKWIPENPSLSNYIEGWRAANFNRYFLNSVIVTVTATIGVLFFSSLTGFALSKFRFPGRRILFAVVIVTMIVPLQVRVVPLYILIRFFGWINTYFALIVPVIITSIGIFMMTQFIKYLPDELVAAARIDGASELLIYSRIVVPLSKPGLAALAIINYMAVWNDFFWPLLVIDKDSMRTLPLGMTRFMGEYFIEYGQFFAISLAVIAPMVAVFLIFQKHFIESAALSGLKG
jgi:multiple sugar transport system permease protein